MIIPLPERIPKPKSKPQANSRTLVVSSSQQGFGLIEVLVALLLLSAAALGYIALQAQSLSATDDAVMRMQALLILTEATERIRVNQDLLDISLYQQLLASNTTPSHINCLLTNGCEPSQTASNDVAILRQQTLAQGMRLAMVTCPGTQNHAKTHCLVVAWNSTLAGYASASTEITTTDNQAVTGCFDDSGSYLFQADCVYREVY
ncbi:type IV pilus modification protein PilV [Psychrobacter sp. FDAARGOS_221]|uniref:type IV pilus modification protein PilV n=1 Tax=Psychrobacter sp. FDAARGOS_221 TaxID=1975705 RepID=UPI00187D1DC4|nr:type IV pilus modification protein PilV [Psychrobacter sp. FDAARGOS_221]